MEYSHLHNIPPVTLRNRLIMLHHFSEMFCSTFPMFDLMPAQSGEPNVLQINLDTLRAVLASSVKVRCLIVYHYCKYILALLYTKVANCVLIVSSAIWKNMHE